MQGLVYHSKVRKKPTHCLEEDIVCRKKYRPTSYQASWLYGMKLSPRQLFILLYCWQTKRSTETAYLLAGVSYTTVRRWFARFRKQLPDSSKLTAMLEGDDWQETAEEAF